LSHLSADGEAQMVDVTEKDVAERSAVAGAFVALAPATLALVRGGELPKGDVLATARVAGICAAKRTPELIPLCHTVALTRVAVEIVLEPEGARITCTAVARDRTGVEMEALVGASTAALTLYDMVKAVEPEASFRVALLDKRGGRSGPRSRRAPW
jgi:cyclic pyranopterin phosphate synthase